MKPSLTNARAIYMVLNLVAIALSLAGCASGHEQFFKSSISQPHPSLAEYDRYNLAAYTGEPRVYVQHFDDALGRQLLEDGFVMLGFSSFNGVQESADEIRNEARRLGAEVVIADSKYSHTVSGAMPITTYSPQTVQTSGTVWTSSGNWATYSGTATGISSQTSLMPYSVARYDQSASYWTRTARPRILGAITVEMTAEDRQRVGANQGARVLACQRDSPAWRADVLAGDYILALDGHPVESTKELTDGLVSRAGQTATLSIMRGNQRRDITVTLNPNPMKAP